MSVRIVRCQECKLPCPTDIRIDQNFTEFRCTDDRKCRVIYKATIITLISVEVFAQSAYVVAGEAITSHV